MNTKQILWANVRALMLERFKEENLYKLNRESAMLGKENEISLGSLTRIKNQDTDIRMSVVDKIAEFFGLEAWQLLIKDLDPTNPPVFILDKKQQEFIDRMKTAYKELVRESHSE